MDGEQPAYRAFLLRLWQVCSGGQLEWRASLEDAHTGARWGFANQEALISFLNQVTGTSGESEDVPSSTAE